MVFVDNKHAFPFQIQGPIWLMVGNGLIGVLWLDRFPFPRNRYAISWRLGWRWEGEKGCSFQLFHDSLTQTKTLDEYGWVGLGLEWNEMDDN
jgi:hypothetical protein